MKKLLLLLFVAFNVNQMWSQEMSITGGNITQCEGFLVDNGFSSSDYSNNVNATATICAPAPETIINLYFAVFDLGNGDYIEIYDGSDTSAPLMGTYFANDLQTTDITSTNASGCLTVHFVSDGNDVGNFGAEISCGPPCERPFAIINSNQDPIPILLCPGEELTMDASASTFAAGTSIQSWEWIFDDGTNNTNSWPSVTHAWDEPGGYKVQLMITDNTDCHNNNLTDYIVFVSTYPDFSLLSPEFDLCQGGLEYMGVNFFIPDSVYADDSLNVWISDPWIDLPQVDLGGYLYIPDDQTNCFESEVTFSNFDYGQTITSVSDMDYFYINFEHSFMGDITITFICPNGQSIAVHQQGGGGTYLGEPIDGGNETAGDTPGIGYDYYWAPDATLGTWEEEASGTLPSGTYQSVQAWENLIGCPLNGTWTIQICDMWGADDGYIFDWGMAFNPNLYGELLQFTPDYGSGCDSTYWTGPFIVDTDDGCDFIGIQIDNTGSYEYTYTVTNNFGCTFDTTITVNVFIASNVSAGPDMMFSCQPITLQGGLEDGLVAQCSAAAGNYSECFGNNENWIQTYCPDNPGDGVTYLTLIINSSDFETCCDEIYIYNGPSTGSPILAGPLTGDLSGQTFTATNSEGCLTLSYSSDGSVSCADGSGDPFDYVISCGDAQVPYVWNWTPATNLSDPTIPNPVIESIAMQTDYVLSGYPVGYPGCGSADTMTVTIDPALPSPGIDTEISICSAYPTFNMFDALEGNPETGGVWYDWMNNLNDEFFDPAVESAGAYYYAIDYNGCILATELLISIEEPEISSDPDTMICIDGTATLNAWSATDFGNTYVYHWSTGEMGQSIEVNPGAPEGYWVYATDPGNCVTDTLYMNVTYRGPLSVTVMNDSTICENGQVDAYVIQDAGGLPPYQYQWSFGGVNVGSGISINHSPSTVGNYCVTMTDACETPAVQDCAYVDIQVPVNITIDSDTTNGCTPLTSNIEITTPDSLYSYANWSLENGLVYNMTDEIMPQIAEVGSYDVTVNLTTDVGCEFTKTYPDYLTVYAIPQAGWIASPQPTNTENAFIQFTDMSSGTGLEYYWVFDTENWLGVSGQQNPGFQFPQDKGGEYNVRLYVTDEHNCSNFIDGIVDINDVLAVYIPNCVTPNYDGVNDEVFVRGADIDQTDFEWIVFDRWGDMVHHSKDPEMPWIIGNDDKDYFVQDGVYNYTLKVKSATTGDARIITGYITVVR